MKNQYYKYHVIRYIFLITLMLVSSSCKKLVEIIPPVTTINSENVFRDDKTAISVLTGLYLDLVSNYTGSGGISVTSALSADELKLYDGSNYPALNAFYTNSLISNPSGSIGGETWVRSYYIIFRCNAAIEELSSTAFLTPSVKKQLLGEAYFVRAFSYFYLINLYGDAALVLGTDPEVNRKLVRTGKPEIYLRIIQDLKEAQSLLSTQYLNADLQPYPAAIERIRPTSGAATALLARIYLYSGNNDSNAEAEATKVISQTILYDILPLNQVFLKNSKEAIWQLQPVRIGRNNEDAFNFILNSSGPGFENPLSISSDLLSSFEANDQRAAAGNWINSVQVGSVVYTYPYKYKATTGTVSEYAMVLRLGEQYLIRAEARANQGKLIGINSAASDLNVIRARAGLPSTTAATKEALLEAIFKERRSELFTEWGHRWLDIKRYGLVDQVMSEAAINKGISWNSYQKLYPIPFIDIRVAPQLIQNPGY
ncbi:RagB/SusD family nutrient uptake outer membrane protein [Pedobacter chinensis]|nr:RagB/SusD family nutrient uptake outer membrane protein [Pedobacter chinensis]